MNLAGRKSRSALRALLGSALLFGALGLCAGCGSGGGGGGGGGGEAPARPSADRGRQVYQANCTACHNPDPALDGSVGPAVKGSSRELLEARILRAEYPPGYAPKRDSGLMPAQPHLADDIDDLAAYLE